MVSSDSHSVLKSPRSHESAMPLHDANKPNLMLETIHLWFMFGSDPKPKRDAVGAICPSINITE